MKNELTLVKHFHYAFEQKYSRTPTLISDKEYELRYSLMAEENVEYLDAAKNNDLVGIADALGDQLYILCGTIIKHGLQNKIEEVFKEIHHSNMSKLGANGKPIFREDGKILKGPAYRKPDLTFVNKP